MARHVRETLDIDSEGEISSGGGRLRERKEEFLRPLSCENSIYWRHWNHQHGLYCACCATRGGRDVVDSRTKAAAAAFSGRQGDDCGRERPGASPKARRAIV